MSNKLDTKGKLVGMVIEERSNIEELRNKIEKLLIQGEMDFEEDVTRKNI